VRCQIQRNNRELETIIQECVLITIRDSIPTEEIIRAYLDESIEQEEEVTIENIPDEDEKPDKSAETPRPNGSAEESADVEEFIKDDREEVPVFTVKI
jgi:hypothetical protein